MIASTVQTAVTSELLICG